MLRSKLFILSLSILLSIYLGNFVVIRGEQDISVTQLVDFEPRMQLIYADVADPPITRTQASQDLYDFHLAVGYESTSYSKIERAADSFSRESKLVYTCGAKVFQHLAAVHVVGNQQHRRFSSTRLLTLLRNKQISFVGDSLGRQYYLDLAAELRPWQSYLQYGALPQLHTLVTYIGYILPASISKESINPSIKDEQSIPVEEKDRFMRRYYASFNVTLLWCEDPQLTHFQNYRFPQAGQNTTTRPEQGEHPSHCDWSALLDSDVLVLSVGAWYKPLFDGDETDFYKDLEQKPQQLRSKASYYRSLVKQHNRHGQSAIVLWTLMPHTGLVDEVTVPGSPLNQTLRATSSSSPTQRLHQDKSSSFGGGWPSQNYSWLPEELAEDGDNVNKLRFEIHGDGKMWSQLTMAAVYPPIYNQILRSIAQEFRDEYLDVYRLSSLYLRHFSHGAPLPLSLPAIQKNADTNSNDVENNSGMHNDWSPETLRQLPSLISQEYQTHLSEMRSSNDNHHVSGKKKLRVETNKKSTAHSDLNGKKYDLQAVHIDSLHYCPGSVYRGAQFLLQAAIEYRWELQRRAERRQKHHNNHVTIDYDEIVQHNNDNNNNDKNDNHVHEPQQNTDHDKLIINVKQTNHFHNGHSNHHNRSPRKSTSNIMYIDLNELMNQQNDNQNNNDDQQNPLFLRRSHHQNHNVDHDD